MGRPSKYSPEVRERAVRMVFEHAAEHPSQWAAIAVGRRETRDPRRNRCGGGCARPSGMRGQRPGLTTDERARLKQLERENRRIEARQRDPAEGVRVFCPGGARPPSEVMVSFIDRSSGDAIGVEPICAVLPIAPSTYFRHKAQQPDPTTRSARAQRDDELRAAIQRVWDEHHQVYGPRKVWRQLRREGVRVARCTRRAADARDGAARRRPRPRVGDHHAAGRGGRPAGRSRRSPVYARRGRISSGSRISPTSRPGAASSTSPS